MKIVIGVFFGGKSTEHEISCISANQVINAINKEKYDVLPIYISKNNEFYIGEKLFDIANYADIVRDPKKELTKVCIYKEGQKAVVKAVSGMFKKEQYIDIAFPVVHGTNVEDGSLAGLLRLLDIPFTSCDVLGGSVGQDKAVMKDIFKANDIPMVDYFIVYNSDFKNNIEDYKQKASSLAYPLIAKPANLGSSIGIEIINNEDEFVEKISECLKYDFKVVVEKMVTSLQEVNISVMGNEDEIKVSVIEDVSKDFLSFEKKYLGGSKSSKGSKVNMKNGSSKGMASTTRKIPAPISEDQQTLIEETAKKVYQILNSYGCVRIDFMIDRETAKVYCNEINTIPGSLAFYLWKEKGVEFDAECDELIKNALIRYNKMSKKTYSFDTNILDGYKK